MTLMQSYASLLVWPAIVALPLVLTTGDLYAYLFPASWYDAAPRDFWNPPAGAAAGTAVARPSPVGLVLGLAAVVVGQVFMLGYFIALRGGILRAASTASTSAPASAVKSSAAKPASIQREGAREYDLNEGLATHLGQPEGFVLLGGYLIISWMTGLMPASYYSFSGGIDWPRVAAQLLVQDFVQYCMHMLEHKLDKRLYILSHKPHHRFTNPRLFDAFNGSITDTVAMILVPLIVTARVVDANVWTYMAFGSLYANWLTLIHSEYPHAWDGAFRRLGLGTAADHHVHHKVFKFNYGHLFMYWDRAFGTYKDPATVALFNKDV